MTILLLVRHGMTDWNDERRYLGHTDVKLNVLGERQAQALAQRLHDEQLEAIYSSNLKRASTTAVMVANQHHLPLQEDGRLREMNFGIFEGLTYETSMALYLDMATIWHADPECPPTHGERLSEMAARVKSWLDEMLTSHLDKRILVVAHGGSLRILLCYLLGLAPVEYWRFNLKPCAITEINWYEAGGILMRLNDDSHLKEQS